MSEVVIFLGPPGAGKGTQAVRLAQDLRLEKISTGDILRDHMARGTELGARVKPIYDAGQLVPDDIMIAMIREKLAAMPDVRVIFDGFPRNLSQARALDLLLEELSCPVNAVVLLDVPEEMLIERMLDRAAKEGRSDDTPDTIRRRQQVYRESTQPLVEYYQSRGNLKRVDGTGTPGEVYERLAAAVH
jgi:adenylate kinase